MMTAISNKNVIKVKRDKKTTRKKVTQRQEDTMPQSS